jgi:predicted nucleic acid-binding protein
MIGANDLFIAAHAGSLGVTLVTNNTREFGRVPKLNIENWTPLSLSWELVPDCASGKSGKI